MKSEFYWGLGCRSVTVGVLEASYFRNLGSKTEPKSEPKFKPRSKPKANPH